MLRSKLRVIFLSILVSLLALACSDNSVGPDHQSFIDPQMLDYSVMDGGDIMADLNDATMDKPMHWGNNIDSLKKGKFRKHRPGRLFLGRILKELELSDDQKELLKPIFESHHSQAKAIHEAFKPQIQHILDSVKVQREAIRARVDAGEITKQEAHDLIKKLNEEKRAQIEATPGFADVKSQLCELKKALLDQIAEILTADQLVKWNEWVANIQDDCLNS